MLRMKYKRNIQLFKLKRFPSILQVRFRDFIIRFILFLICLDDRTIYSKIRQEIDGLEIGVLINNVGMSYQYPEYFEQVENNEEFTENMIRLNVVSVANLTQIILPGFSPFLLH